MDDVSYVGISVQKLRRTPKETESGWSDEEGAKDKYSVNTAVVAWLTRVTHQ